MKLNELHPFILAVGFVAAVSALISLLDWIDHSAVPLALAIVALLFVRLWAARRLRSDELESQSLRNWVRKGTKNV